MTTPADDFYRLVSWAPHYRVGRDGSVWSRIVRGSRYGRLGEWIQLSPVEHRTRAGTYLRVTLRVNGKSFKRYVHRLVLETFVGPCPEGLEACHGDGNPLNNRLDNLRWDTHQSNIEDTMLLDRVPKGSKHHATSLTEQHVLDLVDGSREFPSATHEELGILFGADRKTVGRILRGASWGWLTGIVLSPHPKGRPPGRPQRKRDLI